MAEWRKHYKSMWSDGTFCGLSRNARLLWNGLIDHADDDGYLKADVQTIRVQIFPADPDLADQQIEEMLSELAVSGMLSRRQCADNGRPVVVGWLSRWDRYQTIRRDRKRESNLLPLYELGEDVNQVATSGQPSGNQRAAITRHDMTEHDMTRERSTRSRAPTPVEQHFIDGFKNQYGQEPEIKRDHAIALAQKVKRYGTDEVCRRIDLWWKSPAGDWIKDARTVEPFIKCFDRIVESQGRDNPDETPTERVLRESRNRV